MKLYVMYFLIFSNVLIVLSYAKASQCPNCNLLEKQVETLVKQVKEQNSKINDLVDKINYKEKTLKQYKGFLQGAKDMLKNKKHTQYCPTPENKNYKDCDCESELYGIINTSKAVIQSTKNNIKKLVKQHKEEVKKRGKIVNDLFKADALLSECREKKMFIAKVVGCDDGLSCTKDDQCDNDGNCTGIPVTSCIEP